MGRSVYSCLQRITCPLIQYFLHIFRTYWVNSRVKIHVGTIPSVSIRGVQNDSIGILTCWIRWFRFNRIRKKSQFSTLLINILKTSKCCLGYLLDTLMSPKVSDPQIIAAISRVPVKVLQSIIVSSLLISTFTLFSMTLVSSI